MVSVTFARVASDRDKDVRAREGGAASVAAGTLRGVQSSKPLRMSAGSAQEPHLPVDRLDDDTRVFAPCGARRAVDSGERVVRHMCGDALAAVSLSLPAGNV